MLRQAPSRGGQAAHERFGLLAAEREDAGQSGDVEDVDEAVGGVGGDVLGGGGGRDGDGEIGCHEGDVKDVGVSVVVEVGGPGVCTAVKERVGAGRVLDDGAEAVTVGVVGGNGPGGQVLEG